MPYCKPSFLGKGLYAEKKGYAQQGGLGPTFFKEGKIFLDEADTHASVKFISVKKLLVCWKNISGRIDLP